MDTMDAQWVNGFVGDSEGSSIPEGSMIQGFVSVISWIDPDGEYKWRAYNTIDCPLSNLLGLLEMAKQQYIIDNTINREDS